MYKKFFPPASIKLSEISPHISSNVSTQSEENDGAMMAMFSLPDLENVDSVTVDKSVVKGKSDPILSYTKNKSTSAA